MTKIIYAAATSLLAVWMLFYMNKRKDNNTPMGMGLKQSMMFSVIAILSNNVNLLAGEGMVSLGARAIMLICADWLLYYLWVFTIEYTRMEQKIEFKTFKKILFGMILVDNVLLLTNHGKVHTILCTIFVIAVIVLLIAKKHMAPTIFARKYMTVVVGLLLIILLKVIKIYLGTSIDFAIPAEGLLLMLLYHLAFEHRQNDFVQRMQMLIVEDMQNPIIVFDYEYAIAAYNKSADKLFALSKKAGVNHADYFLENFIEENGFKVIEDIQKDIRFEWDKNNRNYDVEYHWLIDYKKEDKRVGVLFAFHDITKQKRAAKEMEYALTHDYLTQLYNRNYLQMNEKKLFHPLNYPISIALININGMKMINDFYGNTKGDSIILGIAETIQGNVRKNDIPIHLEGDEFMIIMHTTREQEAVELMGKISRIIASKVAPDLGVSVEFAIDSMSKPEDTLDNCMRMAKNTLYQKKMLRGKGVKSSIIESLKKALSESDFETEEHAERTKHMAVRLGERLHISDKEKSELGLLAILHDIGKLSIPDAVLKKPGKLTDEEWEIMKTHTIKGFEIANTTPELAPIANCILHHHERWDGKGYPSGLAGEDIPLLSRIITLIDSHDVMTHDRPYHKAMSAEAAKEEVIRCSGTQFDPQIVEVFLKMLEEDGQVKG